MAPRRIETSRARILAIGLGLCMAPLAWGQSQTYPVDSLVIPMDPTYQHSEMFRAFGLVYRLLRNHIPVDWAIQDPKIYGDVDFSATSFTHATATLPYPSLETLGPNHAFNASEGSDALQPLAPDTADDDKGYLRNVTTGTLDPDPTVLTDNGRPLVFYELLDNNSRTLKLEKAGTSIRILIE